MKQEGIDVVSFDYREEADTLGNCKLQEYPSVEACVSTDPVTLPYDDDSFDAVLSCGVLEHVINPDASLDEIWRVLKPSGVFYIYNLPNRYSYLEEIAKRMGIYYHGKEEPDKKYTKRSAFSLLKRHKFKIEKFGRRNMLPLTLDGKLASKMSGTIWGSSQILSYIYGLNYFATTLEITCRAER